MYSVALGLANKGARAIKHEEDTMKSPAPKDQLVTVAELEMMTARPRPGGFTLTGQGKDGADYELDLRLDMPMNRETRVALGEMLAQSECRISRRVRSAGLQAGARRIPKGTTASRDP